MKRLVYFSVLGLFIVNLTGCAMFSNQEGLKTPPEPLQSQAVFKFADLPVPLGFKLLPLESYAFENSGTRVAILKYQGKANTTQVVNFYKDQMPMFNWSLLNLVEYGNCMLNFERETESCIINIAPKGNLSIINISLGPKSQTSPKKSKQLIK